MRKKKKFLSSLEKEEILKRYIGGEASKLLAEQFGVVDATIISIVKSNGYTINQYTQRMKAINFDLKKAKKMYSNGYSLNQIANIFGCSQLSVSLRFEKEGIARRPKNGPNRIDEKNCANLYLSGKSIRDIAEIMSSSKWVVWKSLHRQNITMRDSHSDPIYIRQAADRMRKRHQQRGNIRIGKNEHLLIKLLAKKYGEVEEQFQIRKGGHFYDAFAGNILWELDEKHHKRTQQFAKDILYEQEANELGYQVRRIWEDDLLESGLINWYNNIDKK